MANTNQTRKDETMIAHANDRDATIKRIRKALRARSGKAWTVRGGRGTSYGWITIEAPPRRRVEFGYTSEADRAELAELLKLDRVHCQGVSIPAGLDYRTEFIDRAEGRTPSRVGQPYWD